jgi:predicted Rdx family selenoprotein
MGPGYDELIPEVLGLDGPRVYISDGAHYDNLGLMQVLRAKCEEIWCIDAPPEKRGEAAELRRVISLAREELGVRIQIDLDRFATDADGLYGSTHAVGTVAYADGAYARLIVVKLGLSGRTPAELLEERQRDPGFPHHATRHQVYRRDRMDSYRRLGYHSAGQCLEELTRFDGI